VLVTPLVTPSSSFDLFSFSSDKKSTGVGGVGKPRYCARFPSDLSARWIRESNSQIIPNFSV
jgi:hypothetical protein